MNMDIKSLARALNSSYGINQEECKNMTFDTVRAMLEVINISTNIDIYKYRIVIFTTVNPLEMASIIYYRDVPQCFNCKVYGFNIDLVHKAIFVKIKEIMP